MRRFTPSRRLWIIVMIAGACLFLGACARVVVAPSSGDPVAASLHKLGVNTATSKRKSPTGTNLPSSFAPLGTTISYGNAANATSQRVSSANDQLLLVGPSTAPSNLTTTCATSMTYPAMLLKFTPSRTAMACFPGASNAWVNPSGNAAVDKTVQSLSSVATGDLDGDGLQELVAAYVAPAGSSSTPWLQLKIIQDSKEGFTTSVTELMSAKNVTDVQVATGDFSGDGHADIVVALAFGGSSNGQLLFLQKVGGRYQVDSSLTKSLPRVPGTDGFAMYFRLATGNLDYDRADELGVVVNEFTTHQHLNFKNNGVSNYYIYDDANHAFQFLKGGVVQGSVGGTTHVALAGDISFGDIDGDGLDEVVMGGPEKLPISCGSTLAGNQVVTALDDAVHGFQVLGTNSQAAAPANCRLGDLVYFTFINTLDLTGSGRDSILANRFVYDYNPNPKSCSSGLCRKLMPGSTSTYITMPNAFFAAGDSLGHVLSPTHAAVAVGDVTGDGRQNVVTYVQWHSHVDIYGLAAHSGWVDRQVAAGSATRTGALRPQLVTTASQVGGLVLRYVGAAQGTGSAAGGGYKETFTQPIVVAALAAPPCRDNAGQNTSACVTTFGRSKSVGSTTSSSVSLTAGVTVGEHVSGGITDFSETAKESIQETATLSTSHSYKLTKAVTYSTSSMKDGVVFTTVPLDQYTYEVVQSRDPSLIGKRVVVSIPRTPIVLIADRSYYNASVPPGALKIDSRVFVHKPGDVSSYPTGPLGPISYGPKEVGEGTGSTQLSIDVSNDYSVGATLAVQYNTSVETTEAGVVTGFNVGVGASDSLQISAGQSTTYTGTVGSIDAADYGAKRYGFGMSAYVQGLDGQEFEVVNYWVQP